MVWFCIGTQSRGFWGKEFPNEATWSGKLWPFSAHKMTSDTREQLIPLDNLQDINAHKIVMVMNITSLIVVGQYLSNSQKQIIIIASYFRVQPDTMSIPNRTGERWDDPDKQSWSAEFWRIVSDPFGLADWTIPVKQGSRTVPHRWMLWQTTGFAFIY